MANVPHLTCRCPTTLSDTSRQSIITLKTARRPSPRRFEMPLEWPFAEDVIRLGGAGIREDDAERQTKTVREILDGLSEQPGIMLCDEVGMGKTYVALAVAASVIVATGGR